MKERIVIADKDVSVVCKGCIKEDYCNKKYAYEQARCCFTCGLIPANIEVEKCPTNWEELKELCKNLKVDLKLTKDGKIYCYEHLLAENRTPAQMWQIIKSLIGEE